MATWVVGAQTPKKYPRTGPKYKKWGEQTHAGLAYDPETDTYHAMSPEEKIALEEQLNPKPYQPGLYESAAAATIPALASTGGLILANSLMGGGAAAGAGAAGAGAAGAGAAGAGAAGAEMSVMGAGQAAELAAANAAAEGGGLGGLLGLEMAPGAASVAVPAAIVAQAILSGRTGLEMLKGDVKPIHKMGLSDITDNPLGTVGRAGLAIATGGLSELANMGLYHKSTKEIEADRWKGLLGLKAPGVEDFYKQLKQNEPNQANYSGRVDDASAPDFVGMSDKGWVNNLFANDRKVENLRAEDIWGSPDVIGAGGQDYFTGRSEEERRRFADELLKRKLISEKKGGIYLTDDQAGADVYKELFGGK